VVASGDMRLGYPGPPVCQEMDAALQGGVIPEGPWRFEGRHLLSTTCLRPPDRQVAWRQIGSCPRGESLY
jgi:hypothetical protein